MWSKLTRQLIDIACEEDLAHGDLTAALLPDFDRPVTARVVPRQPGVICGLALGPTVCAAFADRIGEPIEFTALPHGTRPHLDGDTVTPSQPVATVAGPRAAILAAERTLLNFLGRMSGVATLTRRYVDLARAGNPQVQVLDTRKTTPGWRELDKYAVRIGGGRNHRTGLYDAILIKDNHLAGIPTESLAAELAALLDVRWPEDARPAFIEVEVDNPAQLAEVCKVPSVDIVLLDNFPLDQIRAAVAHRDGQGLRGRVQLEASGGVTLDNVADIAATGIDRISIGALTHSAPCLDIGLDV